MGFVVLEFTRLFFTEVVAKVRREKLGMHRRRVQTVHKFRVGDLKTRVVVKEHVRLLDDFEDWLPNMDG